MPIHDWTRVDSGIFHSFHNAWITHLSEALNRGILPADYYALGEQHAGRIVADILTLHSRSPGEAPSPPPFDVAGGIALAEAPPQVSRKLIGSETYRQRRRTLAIRHVSGHRLVALIEIVSPANKDRPESVEALVGKTIAALDFGVHVLLADLLPPGRHDPRGIHGAVWDEYDEAPYDFPVDCSLTLASYAAGPPVKAYLEHLSIGDQLPEIPLFLTNERYIPTPLDATYTAAFQGMPAFWRDVAEG